MYFVRARALRELLSQRDLSGPEQVRYFTGLVVVWGAPFAVEAPSGAMDVAMLVATTLIAGLGAYYAFHSTDRALRSRFVHLVVPLGFVVAIRVALAALLVAAALGGVLAFRPELLDASQELLLAVTLAIFLLFQAAYWVLVARQLGRVRHADA